MNEWSYTSVPLTCLHDVYTHFTFYSLLPFCICTSLRYFVCILSASLCVIRAPKLKFVLNRILGVRGNPLFLHFGDARFEYRHGYSAVLGGLLCLSIHLPNKTRHISLNRPRRLRPISSPFLLITSCFLYHNDGTILCPSKGKAVPLQEVKFPRFHDNGTGW